MVTWREGAGKMLTRMLKVVDDGGWLEIDLPEPEGRSGDEDVRISMIITPAEVRRGRNTLCKPDPHCARRSLLSLPMTQCGAGAWQS